MRFDRWQMAWNGGRVMNQTIKQKTALSQRYDMRPDHFRFPRQQPQSMRHVRFADQDRVTWKEAALWAACFAGLGLMCFAALAVKVV